MLWIILTEIEAITVSSNLEIIPKSKWNFWWKIWKFSIFTIKYEAFGRKITLYDHLKGNNTRNNLFRVLVMEFFKVSINSGSNDV